MNQMYKVSLYFLLSAVLFSENAYAFKGQSSTKEQRQQSRERQIARDQQKSCEFQEYRNKFSDMKVANYAKFSYGFTKYIVPSTYWHTSSTPIASSITSHDALMSTNRTLMMPLFRGALGLQFTDIPCWFNPNKKRRVSLGIEVSYARKDNAYKATYTNFLSNQGSTTAYQDVHRATIMATASFDALRSRCNMYGLNLDLGIGMVTGALKNLKLYDLNTQLFRGETLPSYKKAVAGFVGCSLVRYFDQTNMDLELSYRVVMNRVNYKNVVIRTNGVSGSQTYSNPAALSVPQYVTYPVGKSDSLFVYSNEFTLALSKAF